MQQEGFAGAQKHINATKGTSTHDNKALTLVNLPVLVSTWFATYCRLASQAPCSWALRRTREPMLVSAC
jgi:hypothetical protein